MNDESRRRNALADQTSPYLLQHADNPVDWHPWNEAALEKARREDKPILLSVGYSACHWCHVMAHESFENVETAALMNDLFVNIKVDREERPDLDKIYQLAQQLLTRRTGGWPLTMFLAPDDQTPFFGGTYFPPTSRYGYPGFRDVLVRVAQFYAENRAEIRQQNTSLVAALDRTEPASSASGELDLEPIARARELLEEAFDERFGGFGNAPKFPHPTNIERLLRAHIGSAGQPEADDRAREMALLTLRQMSAGGIYDHLGGGFCRYSVDAMWMIPHFEKMLYDNAPLLELYVRAWQLEADPEFERTARETAAWVMREMQSPQGGYYSTLDADSEGEEGKFYIWMPDEVRKILGDGEYGLFAARFGLDGAPNFEDRAWHLHAHRDSATLSEATGLTVDSVDAHLVSARRKLFEVRSQRIWPGRDEKILTSWNALMVRAMTIAGRTLGDHAMLDSAERARDFLVETMWQDGRLLATCKDGRAHLAAYLDDYAFTLDALLALLETRWRRDDLDLAIQLADVMLAHFEDRERGGFYFTADDHERLIHRSRPFMDDALPAGNGVAAAALARLGHLLGEIRYVDAAERTLRAAWDGLQQAPHAHNALLNALEEIIEPPQIVVIRATPDSLPVWLGRCLQGYVPGRWTVAVPAEETDLPGLLGERLARGDAVAYVCEGHRCQAPIEHFGELDAALAAGEV